jgi:PTS system fructose-specific IIC component
MRASVLNSRQVLLSLPPEGWRAAVEALAVPLREQERITSVAEFVDAVAEREAVSSTYCGQRIAIPHAASRVVRVPSLCVGRTTGFAWHEAEEWVELVFLLAIPASEPGAEGADLHIEILSTIAELALEKENIDRWLAASTADEIVDSIGSALARKGVLASAAINGDVR